VLTGLEKESKNIIPILYNKLNQDGDQQSNSKFKNAKLKWPNWYITTTKFVAGDDRTIL